MKRIKEYTSVFIVIIILIASLFLIRCTDPDGATRVLSAAGYKDITITGWRPFDKSKDDWYATGFEATAPNGTRISGVVNSGFLFKGSTIRID